MSPQHSPDLTPIVVALGLLVLNFTTHKLVRDFKPLVIRIDQIGRAEAIAYQNLTYKPQDVEMKVLSQFCKLHYMRNRTTLKDSFSQSLYFIEGVLANTILEPLQDSQLNQIVQGSEARDLSSHYDSVRLKCSKLRTSLRNDILSRRLAPVSSRQGRHEIAEPE